MWIHPEEESNGKQMCSDP